MTKLPEIYQVYCPNPVPLNWSNLMKLVVPNKRSSGTRKYYYLIENKNWQTFATPISGIPIITFEEWERLLTNPPKEEIIINNQKQTEYVSKTIVSVPPVTIKCGERKAGRVINGKVKVSAITTGYRCNRAITSSQGD